MAGHSKWARIKRKKAVTDAKRGKLFTKLLKEVQVAAKLGGGSPEGNSRLKTAIQTAKSNSVPQDNIERAIQKGAGDSEGVDYEEVVYEAYGPAGVAIIIKALTDNKNRTVAEVRHALTRHNASLGGSNSVAYLFEEKGVLTIPKDEASEEELFDVALEAGAEDIRDEDDVWVVQMALNQFGSVRDAVEKVTEKYEGELQYLPTTSVKVAGKDAELLLKLLEMLDDLDDTQSVTANFEIDDEELNNVEMADA